MSRNPNPVLSTYVPYKSNRTGATSRAGTSWVTLVEQELVGSNHRL